MSDFNPGPEWRESNGIPDGVEGIMLFPAGKQIEPRRTWVREYLVPPLPTDLYTVIRVTWQDGDDDLRELTLHPVDRFMDEPYWVHSQGSYYKADELLAAITGFEVLASPVSDRYTPAGIVATEKRVRQETVKAVLNHIADEPWAREVDLQRWRTKFGVNE